jgi:N-ethylmaleimide reductase
MSHARLFSPFQLGDVELKNRLVMAPMTRSRAIGNVPNALMATYYAQRADAGLLVTEGTAPSPNGLGYARIPGLYSAAQVEGWKLVTSAVHARGGRIFAQLMHTGRIGHPLNLPEGGELVAPSAVAAPGEMYTDAEGPQPHPTPREMTEADIQTAIDELVRASENAVAAGFDGVELHGANGYLIDQFLNPISNRRTDAWGGSVEKQARFAVEVARATANAIGKQRVGIRLSPFGAFNGLGAFEGTEDAFVHYAAELGKVGLVYLHVVDHSAMGAPEVPASVKSRMREAFGGTVILSGGYDADRAEADLAAGHGELVAFGRPFLSNPDLVERFRRGAALSAPDFATFYTPGEVGYTDYPTLD